MAVPYIPTEATLTDHTVKQLREYAKAEGINLHGADVKGQILKAIYEHFETLVPGPPSEESQPAERASVPSEKPVPTMSTAEAVIRSTFAIGSLEAVLRGAGHINLPPGTDKLAGFSEGEFALIRKRASAGYHLVDGIFFLRLPDGGVRVQKSRTVAGYPPDGSTPFSFDLERESWVTIVEEMSARENSLELHQSASSIHG